MKIIQSEFQNTCGLCGDQIEVGQDISPLQKRWYHTECTQGQQIADQKHQFRMRVRIIPTGHPPRTPLSGDRDLLADVGALIPPEVWSQMDK